jgi:hypothetical protein
MPNKKMTIIFLGAGVHRATDDERYPIWLSEINGKTVVERSLDFLTPLSQSKENTVIFLVKQSDVDSFHVQNALHCLAPDSKIIGVSNDTEGAACTALLAIDHIEKDSPLLIMNMDEFIDGEISGIDYISKFSNENFDAGVLTFHSIHPRYSFVAIDNEGIVFEAAEKNPISSNATAGFYWYSKGSSFIDGAKEMIRKEARLGDGYYICPIFNSIILAGGKVKAIQIPASNYHPLKNQSQIQYENRT